MIGLAACLVVGCGDDTRPAAAAPSKQSPANDSIMPARTIEVYVDHEPTKPYYIIAIHRYPSPSNAGAEVESLKHKAYDEGGDAILLKVRSESLSRENIDPESLLEVEVLAWKKP